jgi:hypothetical protein
MIDSENVKPEYIEELTHECFRVVVFLGANVKRLDLPLVNAVQALGSRACYVQISGHGPSALDFHIAYYIGKLSAEHPGAYFHIVSKDKGFDPLIDHLKNLKVLCSRSASVLEIPLLKSTNKQSPKLRANDFYTERIVPEKARPSTVTTLKNAILTHFHKVLTSDEIDQVFDALIANELVVVNGKKVAYPKRS